ncbi:MAG: lamin tail domain-containing protein, partial [Bacteroidia bacterium]|nr:lamin tail domain-containing protein [Bacteroidia bacterium]
MTYKKLPLVFLFIMTSIFGFGQVSDLIISEYGEGSNNNKYIEIYNGTGNPVNLVDYSLELYSNGSNTSSAQHTFAFGTVLSSGDVYVLYNSSADPIIIAQGDEATSPPNFNGDDAVTLSKLGTIIDMIGEVGLD